MTNNEMKEEILYLLSFTETDTAIIVLVDDSD